MYATSAGRNADLIAHVEKTWALVLFRKIDDIDAEVRRAFADRLGGAARAEPGDRDVCSSEDVVCEAVFGGKRPVDLTGLGGVDDGAIGEAAIDVGDDRADGGAQREAKTLNPSHAGMVGRQPPRDGADQFQIGGAGHSQAFDRRDLKIREALDALLERQAECGDAAKRSAWIDDEGRVIDGVCGVR